MILHLPRRFDPVTFKGLAKLYSFAICNQNIASLVASNSEMYLKRFINIYNPQLDTSYVEQKVANIVARRLRKRGRDLSLLTCH
jgi:hypothetical protein